MKLTGFPEAEEIYGEESPISSVFEGDNWPFTRTDIGHLTSKHLFLDLEMCKSGFCLSCLGADTMNTHLNFENNF